MVIWFFLFISLNNKKNVYNGSINKNNAGKVIKKEKITQKDIKKDETLQEKISNYNVPLQNMLRMICSWRKNIEEVTCESSYKIWEPRIYWFVVYAYNKESLSFDDAVLLLYNNILKSCWNLSKIEQNELLQFIKSNNTMCEWNLLKYMKRDEKKLNIFFKENNISKENISKPFKLYSSLSETYEWNVVEGTKLKILVIDSINKNLSKQWKKIDNFKKEILSYVGADNITNLKHIIIKKYEDIFDKYDLSKYWLKKEWNIDYFKWDKILRSNKKLFIKLVSNKSFQDDYNELFKYISVYTYISKDFLWAKYKAKALFWKEWPWLINLLEVYNMYNEK